MPEGRLVSCGQDRAMDIFSWDLFLVLGLPYPWRSPHPQGCGRLTCSL